MAETIAATIAVRRDTLANFAAVGYVPALGEPIAVVDAVSGHVTEFLIGDGASTVAQLPSLITGGGGGGTVNLPYDPASQTYEPSGTPVIPSLDPNTGLLSPAAMTALDARYPSTSVVVKPWAPSTAYAVGQAVVSPSGDVVVSATAHTSGSSFSGLVSAGGNWNLSSTFVRAWTPNTAYTAGVGVITPAGDFATALTSFTSGASFTATNWRISAPVVSPALTGVPTTPTPASTDNSQTIANTAFVQALIATVAATFGVAIVAWDSTAKAWTATTRPTALIVILVSTDDSTCNTAPTWRQNGDVWIPHPDAVIS